MHILLVVVLLVIVIIFGISSGMQSYATAQQARAQIEVAQVAQVNAWGNLITILTLVLVIVAVLALAAALLWVLYKRAVNKGERHGNRPAQLTADGPRASVLSLDMLIWLEVLRTLKAMQPPSNSTATTLAAPRDEEVVEDPLSWLR